jgi:hypothetical protein
VAADRSQRFVAREGVLDYALVRFQDGVQQFVHIPIVVNDKDSLGLFHPQRP